MTNFFDIHSKYVDELLSTAPTYVKTVRVRARQAVAGEKLVTRLKDGSEETARTLDGSEIVVTNPGGEEYAMAQEKFETRYSLEPDGWYRAVGEVRAVKNPTEERIAVRAPWGELQYGDANCVLAENPADSADRYIIGGAEFAEAYTVKEES